MNKDLHKDYPTTEISVSFWRQIWQEVWKDRLARISILIIVIYIIMALWGTMVWWRYNIHDIEFPDSFSFLKKFLVKVLFADNTRGIIPPYNRQNIDEIYQPPSWKHPMGTDGLGRDILSRVLQGGRISFQVGIITSLIAIPIGVILGAIAGYFGGRCDDFIVWLYSTVESMPGLLFILAISMVVGKGILGIYLGIGLSTWVGICRLIRGEVMKHRELAYVKACYALGFGHFRILFCHILPNISHLIVITFSVRFPAAVSTEVFMSYLGIGIQDEPSWGIMLSNARLRLWHGVWWELVFTTFVIFIVVLSFNIVGDRLRDAMDPKLRTEARQ